MFKKICSVFLSLMLFMFSVPMNAFAAESSASLVTEVSPVPKTVEATLVSDTGEVFSVVGGKNKYSC